MQKETLGTCDAVNLLIPGAQFSSAAGEHICNFAVLFIACLEEQIVLNICTDVLAVQTGIAIL